MRMPSSAAALDESAKAFPGAEHRVADQHVGGRSTGIADLEHRHASAEEGTHMVDRLQLDAGGSERNDRRRVAVHDGLHLRPYLVDLAMNEALEIDGAAARID